MQTNAQKIEKNLGTTNTQLDDGFDSYDDNYGMDFEGDRPESIYQDTRNAGKNSNSPQGKEDPFSLEGQDDFEVGDDAGDAQSLKLELEKYEANAIAKNSNLSEEEKKHFQVRIEKLIHAIDLGTGGTDNVKSEFDSIQQEVSTASIYSSSLRSLATTTGMDPAELAPLFRKYGLNEDKLPTPPDPKVAAVAAMLNDEVFAEKLGGLKENVANAEKDLKEEISKQTTTANSLNDQAKSEINKQRSSDDSSYKYLYDAYFHQDDKSKKLVDARLQLADGVAQILSGLYGKDIKADQNPENAGCVVINNSSFNIMSDSSSGKINFSNQTAIDWPKVTVVPFELNNNGDGKTKPPAWMKEANYPIDVFNGYHFFGEGGRDMWWQIPLIAATGGVSGLLEGWNFSKRGDDISPTVGELRNIGVQSTGESENQTVGQDKTENKDAGSDTNKKS